MCKRVCVVQVEHITSRLRTSLTLAQPTIGNWTHSYTWDNARRLDTLTGSSGSFDYDYIAAATSGDYASRLVKKLTVPTTSAGPNITNIWETTGRLTETKLVNGGTTLNRHAYVLNAAHQRTLCAPGGAIVLPVATTPVFGGRCRHFLGIVHLPTKRAPRTKVDRGAVLECHQVKTVVASSWAAVLAVNPLREVCPVPATLLETLGGDVRDCGSRAGRGDDRLGGAAPGTEPPAPGMGGERFPAAGPSDFRRTVPL